MTRVLIIDDDPDVRFVMNTLMTQQGYEVMTAESREDALVKLEEFAPSVILLDVLLSGTDGRELCREIRSQSGQNIQHIPVIMISAHPGAAENISSYGANDFISKPINTHYLLSKIESFTRQ